MQKFHPTTAIHRLLLITGMHVSYKYGTASKMHELNNVTDAAILAIRGYDQLLQQLSQLVDEILSHSSDQLQPQCCSSYTYSCVINNSITSKFVCLFLHAVLFQGPSAGGNSETSSESPPGKSQSKYGVSLGHFPDITVYLQAHTLSY